jgi:hypothetical protein
MKLRTEQTSFVAGTLGPAARGRRDSAAYRAGAAALLNCRPLATGGQLSRWGSRFIAGCSTATRLEEFAFSTEQSYLVLFQHGRIDFFFAADGQWAGELTGTPWQWWQLPEIRVAQAGDVMWVVHPSHSPRLIRRLGVAWWSLEGLAYDSPKATPFYRYAEPFVEAAWNVPEARLGFRGTGPLRVEHLNTVIRVWDAPASRWRHGTITEVIDTANARVAWQDGAPPDGGWTLLWEEQAFSWVRGWPRSVCLYQQRLIFGGSRDAGDVIWMSRPGQFWNFDLGTASAADAIQIALATAQVRTITHSVGGPQLTFMTEGACFYVPQSATTPITPTSLRVDLIAPHGVGNIRPGLFDGGVLLVQRNGRAVRDLSYSNERDNVVATPVSLVATEMLGQVVDAAYLSAAQEGAEQYAFFVTADGRMAVFHSIREQQIGAWVEWTTAGFYRAVGVAGERVYAVVERMGSWRLELFDAGLAFDSAFQQAPPFSVPWLAGMPVHGRVGADYLGSGVATETGALVVARQAPESGGIVPGTVCELGLAFDWRIETLPPAVALPTGPLVGQRQRIFRIGLQLINAYAAKVGPDRLLLLVDDFDPEAPPPAWQGWWWVKQLGWDTDPQLIVTRDVPMPTGILSMVREIVV